MNILNKLLSNIFVDKYNCIVCDSELHMPERHGICPTCMANMPINDGTNICQLCGKSMADEARYCLTCQNNTFFFDICRSYFVYKDDAKKLIHHLKFGGGKWLVKYLAEFYIDMYREHGYSADIIVSVPISKGRVRERGYNQSAEIAKILETRLGIPYIEDAVVKSKELCPQEKLGGRERLSSVVGAFTLTNRDAVKDKNILLIDDVLTTGATMSAVSMELKKVCRRIECLVLASPAVTYKERTGDIMADYEMELERY